MANLLRRGDFKGVDNLDKLPDELLVGIISLLPFKDAVRTCVLSKRWRYLYVSMSNIVLDFEGVTTENKADFDVDELFIMRKRCYRYKLFVDKLCIRKIVSRHLGPLSIGRWIEAVTWRGMRELEIRAPFTFILPHDLFTSKTLEVLVLESGSYSDKEFTPSDLRFEVPAKVTLPNLKHLHLKELTFADNDSLNRLVSSCPALEKLVCYLWDNDTKITVCSTTLKWLVLKFTCSCPTDWSGSFDIVVNVPNLEIFQFSCNALTSQSIVVGSSLAHVDYDLRPTFPYRSHYIKDAEAVLRSISSTRTLNINDTILFIYQKLNISIPVFQNVTRLIIMYCFAGLGALPYLLIRCKSVECLEFWGVEKWSPDDGWTMLRESGVSCLRYRLKLIRFVNFEPGKDQIEMVKFFLKSSWVLERMEIYHREEIDERTVSMIKWFPKFSRFCYVKLIRFMDR